MAEQCSKCLYCKLQVFWKYTWTCFRVLNVAAKLFKGLKMYTYTVNRNDTFSRNVYLCKTIIIKITLSILKTHTNTNFFDYNLYNARSDLCILSWIIRTLVFANDKNTCCSAPVHLHAVKLVPVLTWIAMSWTIMVLL